MKKTNDLKEFLDEQNFLATTIDQNGDETSVKVSVNSSPNEFFYNCLDNNLKWRINWDTLADPYFQDWREAEMSAKILRALREYKPVHFLGTSYIVGKGKALEILDHLEKKIKIWKKHYDVEIDVDDANCLSLSVRDEKMQPIQARSDFMKAIRKALVSGKSIFFQGQTYCPDSEDEDVKVSALETYLDTSITAQCYSAEIGVNDHNYLIINSIDQVRVFCKFCNEQLPLIRDYNTPNSCDCGCFYWPEDFHDVEEAKQEFADSFQVAVDDCEFRISREFDRISDDEHSPGDEWVLIFARVRE